MTTDIKQHVFCRIVLFLLLLGGWLLSWQAFDALLLPVKPSSDTAAFYEPSEQLSVSTLISIYSGVYCAGWSFMLIIAWRLFSRPHTER